MAGMGITEYRCDMFGCSSRESFRTGPGTAKDARAAGWVAWVRNGKAIDMCPSCDARLSQLIRGEQPALELDEPAPTTSHDVATTSHDVATTSPRIPAAALTDPLVAAGVTA